MVHIHITKHIRKPAGRNRQRIPAGFLSAWLLIASVVLYSVCPAASAGYLAENALEAVQAEPLMVREKEQTRIADGELHSLSAVLMDGNNGRILYDKAGEEIRANASTTKILTCILALEYGDPDDTVIVSSYAAKMPDVQLNIREGEEYRLKDLLYSLMLESHNDSAVAIAEHISGSVEAFSELMNRKAKDIGCIHTHFITPNGLDAQDEDGIHGTTAADLARIMRYCIRQSPERERFLEITRTGTYSFHDLSGNRSFTCNNHNAFLHMMDGALTGKTGFTGSAGYCYVGAVEQDGRLLIVALLGCGWPGNKTYKWADTKKLMNYGFTNYTEHRIRDDILKKTEIPLAADTDGRPGEAGGQETVSWDCHFSETILLREDEEIRLQYLLPEKLELPLAKGMQIGSVVLSIDETVYGIYPVYLTEDREKKVSFADVLKQYAREYITRNYSK